MPEEPQFPAPDPLDASAPQDQGGPAGRRNNGLMAGVIGLAVVTIVVIGLVVVMWPGGADEPERAETRNAADTSLLPSGQPEAPAPADVGDVGDGLPAGGVSLDESFSREPGASAPSTAASEAPVILTGEVVSFRGEQVYVCATGDGHGVSHLGVTAFPGATGAQTTAKLPGLCDTAAGVLHELFATVGDGDVDLGAPVTVTAQGRRAECAPIGDGIMRCTVQPAEGVPEKETPLVTVWDVAGS